MADNKRGRPSKYSVDDIIEQLNKFIDARDEPLVQEFILGYGISHSRFYALAEDSQELQDTIKKAIVKQEVFLIKNTERGSINPTFAIFRLKQKQFGWTDKQEIDQNIGNKDNKPFEVKQNLDNLSIEELKQLQSILKKTNN